MINDHEAVMFLTEPLSGRIIETNSAATRFYGYSKDELLGMTIQDINTLGEREVRKLRMKALRRGQRHFTVPHRLKNGEIRTVDIYSSPIDYNGEKVLFAIIFDVTAREEAVKQIRYLAYHDYITGLYNKRFFDEEFFRLYNGDADTYPLAILMGDVNGLKLFNDSFGHLEGDKALKDIANRIKEIIDEGDVLARVGGDEFAIIVTQRKEEADVRRYLDQIEQHVNFNEKNRKKSLTISFGYGIQRSREDTPDDLMREAEAFMFNRKYYNSRSTRSNTVNVIMDTLFAKSEREKNHSERVGFICEAIAAGMQLDKRSIDKIRVAGLLHDIGKIGIDGSILNKIGKLDKKEWETMKLHPAKGAGILDNTTEFREIADFVLYHHERYDGKGYPNGLKGEEIPLAARIIAVADAFDAMTNDRSYRTKMSCEAVIAELKKCAGSHFDPEIVAVFVEKVLSDEVFRERCRSRPSDETPPVA
jgi:diguanylate cyclase (GGDEF)-like protein/PAS domain S-box-containing protein